MSDDAGARGAIVLDSTHPSRERLVLAVTKAGLVSRALAPGEGVASGEQLPFELAGLHPARRRAPVQEAPADQVALQRLATTMCTVGELPVPRPVCPQP